MARAAHDLFGPRIRTGLVIWPPGAGGADIPFELVVGGHPMPTAESERAGRRALEVAGALEPDESLLVLLSGGASALMAVPAAGLTLADKQATTRHLLRAGADIHELNTVRKHLSAIKGGWLAAAAPGACRTFAISDVVGDDPSVIGSGPTVPDASTFRDAFDILQRFAGGAAERVSARGARTHGRRRARRGARHAQAERRAAVARGHVGHRRAAARDGRRRRRRRVARLPRHPHRRCRGRRGAVPGRLASARGAGPRGRRRPRPACIVSSGETTVRVTGDGKGGRNQEFALACAAALAALGAPAMLASVGTDGIDGPTDAAGAIVDATTLDRGARRRARSGRISRPQRRLSLFRAARRPHSHGTDRHECRRPPVFLLA